MAKIAFIGAGSLGFAQRLAADILHCPELQDTHFALMDIDTTRLDYTRRLCERVIKEQDLPATITATTDRAEAVRDADFVVIMVLAQGFEPIKVEYDIPKKHGIDQCIGDTLGPAGVFRFLRTAPLVLDICRDVLELAKPECWILNYTNPMAMLTWAANEAFEGIRFVGLCHSVQGTTEQLAKAIDVDYEDVRYHVAGINHQAWVLDFRHRDGTDLYPRLRTTLPNSKLYSTDDEDCDMVRIEMMKHLGYFVTESSGHNSEYNPWFRKRDDLIERYTGPGFSGESGYILKLYGSDRENYEHQLDAEVNQPGELEFKRSNEFGSYIIDAICRDAACRINGNVMNANLIGNLPAGCCVEVPCLVDGRGIHPCRVGDLPPQCAALNRTNVSVQELAVKALLTRSRDHVYHAIYNDPLTAAKLSLAEIKEMTDELFKVETQNNWLPELK